MAERIKVMTVVGTRPEIIRLSRVLDALDERTDHVLVHTGQNYDPQLSEVFFRELQLREPAHYLDVAKPTLGEFLGHLFIKFEKVLDSERPDALLVLGDTNSALSSLLAKRKGVPVFHMEAGNRCFDANVPEETNRRVVDHFADINLVYTEHARRNLLAEGLHPRSIYLTGSPLAEVLAHSAASARSSTILDQLSLRAGEYFLLSVHREENVDDPERLRSLLESVSELADRAALPVIVSTHPRLRKRWLEHGLHTSERLAFHEPFGYFDYQALQMAARCVLSDSGTISEESAMLGFPAVTLRNSIERPEALDAGTIILAGPTPESLASAVSLAEMNHVRSEARSIPAEYAITNCSERVVNLITSITPVHRSWAGLRAPGH